jgi:hypothetical protein
LLDPTGRYKVYVGLHFFYSRAKGGNEVGKRSLVTRFEVFIGAKIHPMHIRHYGMEAHGGGVGCGGIATLKFNIDPRKGYVATMSQALYSQGKGPDYPSNKTGWGPGVA